MSELAAADRNVSPRQWTERNPIWEVSGARPHAGSRFAKRKGDAREAGPPSDPLDRATGLPISLNADRALCLALRRELDLPERAVMISETRPWASATFSGSRHRVEIQLWSIATLSRATRFQTQVDVTKLDLPGHLVAELSISVLGSVCLPGGDCRIVVEALTVKVAK
jgi:hypothetical protein